MTTAERGQPYRCPRPVHLCRRTLGGHPSPLSPGRHGGTAPRLRSAHLVATNPRRAATTSAACPRSASRRRTPDRPFTLRSLSRGTLAVSRVLRATGEAAVFVLVRHAHAGSKKQWSGPDHERPLSRRGQEQARDLAGVLAGLGVTRLLSSPALRCRETLQPAS